MVDVAKHPVLLNNVFDDVGQVIDLLEQHAPYTPLGGWYNPGADPHARTRPMWFQNDWVHDTYHAPGSELFLRNPTYIEAAKDWYDAEVVEPHSVYVNVMTSIAEGGPAHTDNPRFHGRDRANTPMWLLRTMLWSQLFRAEEIVQATAIWWLADVDGGALRYWPNGPDQPPTTLDKDMANTALFGDNHHMFHQVGPIGPTPHGSVLVTPSAQLAPAGDEWEVTDHGETVLRSPLHELRVSVLWKADVFASAARRDEAAANPLSMNDVADRLDFDLAQLDHPDTRATLANRFPEARPGNAWPSVFETLAAS